MVSVKQKYMQSMFSTQYVKCAFKIGAVVYVVAVAGS